jgi:hypothetical protein
MLGDGNLVRYKGGARYSIALSRASISLRDHLKYLQWIADNALKPLGIAPCRGHPKLRTVMRGDKPYAFAVLTTCLSPTLTSLYDEWYSGGGWVNKGTDLYIRGATKILPKRLLSSTVLPTLTLVPWFLEDGSSLQYSGSPTIQVCFYTPAFSESEVSHLTTMLNNRGIVTIKPRKQDVVRGSGLSILLAQSSVNQFMDLVEPTILSIFGDSKWPSYLKMVKRKPEA